VAWKTSRVLVHKGIIALFCAYRAELQIICTNNMQSFLCAYSNSLAWTVLITRLAGNGFQIQLRTNEGGGDLTNYGGLAVRKRARGSTLLCILSLLDRASYW
jgi:hypothetical protein